MTTGILHDQNLEKHIEKQMGCMAGFFQIFDRYHILTGKRLHANKRLPPPVIDSTPEPEPPMPDSSKPSPAPEIVTTPAEKQTRSPLKSFKELPRFSLDSRATFASGDDMRGSPSVVARLMGLEPLQQSNLEPAKNSELRRSSSESRSRDPLLYRFIDNDSFHLNQSNQSRSNVVSRNNAVVQNTICITALTRGTTLHSHSTGSSPWRSSRQQQQQQRKNYFATEDSFPEPKQVAASIYGEIERRLRTRGVVDEQASDLEALKHILEALHLKGLLHSHKASPHVNDQSPIVVMKPSRSPISPQKRRVAADSPPAGYRTGNGVRRSLNYGCECSPAASPRGERPENDRRARNSSSPTRREVINARNSNSPARGRALRVETQRRAAYPVNSPKLSPKRIGSDQTITNRSPRNKNPTARIDPKPKEKIEVVIPEDELSSSVSESSVSTPSQADTERSKMEESRGGSSLLERCDKLLRNIGEMAATEMQPSPVSVLDSSFYKEESFSPSPIMKRSIDFKELPGEFEEEIWSPATSPIQSTREDKSDDSDFIYISEILRASNYLPDESDLFLLLEKQQYLIGNDTSKDSMLQRKLIFDTIAEILNAKNQLPPWKVISSPRSSNTEKPSLHQIWIEFQRIRERDTGEEDLFDIICSLLRKDMAGDVINGWGDSPVEMSETALYIERLIFKDLVGETMRDLGNSDWIRNVVSGPCRTLFF